VVQRRRHAGAGRRQGRRPAHHARPGSRGRRARRRAARRRRRAAGDGGGAAVHLGAAARHARRGGGAGPEPRARRRRPRAPRPRARSVAAANAGDVSGYLRLSESAVGGYERAGDLRSALGPRINVGFALTELGLHAEAEQTLREALAQSQRLGVSSVTGSALQNLGWALAGLGRLDEARAVESEAVELYRMQGARYCEGASRLYLGRILGAAGDLDAAEAQLDQAVDILAVAPPLRVYAQAALAEVQLRAGRRARGLELAVEAATTLAALGEITEGESLVLLVHAEALASAGRADEARRALAAARGRLLARAAKISDPDLRERFLTAVPENAATLRYGTHG
jgi:tetratricopeptide (TPR) repeat protein